MPHKVDVTRRCADLLAALARTANVMQACRETGVSKYWAYRRRKADADFAARWVTAIRAGERRAARAAVARARRPLGDPGEAVTGLIVQGRAGTGTRRLQPAARDSFCPARRAVFLDTLRATCNVQVARRAAGVGSTTVYRHYHEDAAFRADWESALAGGRVHLEMALLGAARALFETPDEQADPVGFETADERVEQAHPVVGPAAITGMDAKVALQLLRLHGPRNGVGRARGRWAKPADADATRREILAKVAAVRAANAREAQRETGADQPCSNSAISDHAHPGEGRGPVATDPEGRPVVRCSPKLDPGFRRGGASGGMSGTPDGTPDDAG